MKHLKYIILAILGFWLFASCEEDFDNPTYNQGETVPPEFNLSFTEYTLLDTFATDTVIFNWYPVQYNIEDLEAPTYRLQMKHTDSTEFFELGSTTDTCFKISVGDLNTKLLNEGYPFDVALDFKLRLFAFISDDAPSTEIYSGETAVTFTVYEPAEEPPAEIAKLWVPGDYQGWNPAEAPNVYSPDDDGNYTGYIYFPPGGTFEFKFTSDPDWDHTNYGDGGDGMLDTDPGAGNLTVDGESTYYMTVDTEGLTWTNEVRNFALIGTFNDWAGDEPLTWDEENQVFTITMDFEAGAEFKWRANEDPDWTYNFGLNDPDDGTLVQDGANIVIEEAGNYTVILDLYEPVPTYEIIQN